MSRWAYEMLREFSYRLYQEYCVDEVVLEFDRNTAAKIYDDLEAFRAKITPDPSKGFTQEFNVLPNYYPDLSNPQCFNVDDMRVKRVILPYEAEIHLGGTPLRIRIRKP